MGIHVTAEIPARPKAIEGLVTGIALVSLDQMRSGRIPPLYGGGIQYRREPARRERWQTAAETAARRQGDCEDLVAYRVAELWHAGERAARVHVRREGPTLFHVLVRRADGSIEDPSSKLGMRGG